MNVLYPLAHSVQASREDVNLLSALLQAEGSALPAESAEQDATLDRLVHKPWGYEYRVYADAFYDLWHLCLRPGQSTSLHCHPRKVTALICLSGEGTVRLLGHRQPVTAMTCLHLGKGVFHATENGGQTDLDLIEVEVPRNKLDLVRARDRYGRAGMGYEQPDPYHEVPEMLPSAHRPGSKLRSSSLHRHYQFAVMTRQEIACHAELRHLLCVSLGIAGALQHTVEVFAGHLPPQTSEECYFTMTPVREEREAVYA
jgi:mannose-6-phosphate isomerase-like protein (cupin superfamily)